MHYRRSNSTKSISLNTYLSSLCSDILLQVQLEADRVRQEEERVASRLRAGEEAMARERDELEAGRREMAAQQKDLAVQVAANLKEASGVQDLSRQIELRQAKVR